MIITSKICAKKMFFWNYGRIKEDPNFSFYELFIYLLISGSGLMLKFTFTQDFHSYFWLKMLALFWNSAQEFFWRGA